MVQFLEACTMLDYDLKYNKRSLNLTIKTTIMNFSKKNHELNKSNRSVVSKKLLVIAILFIGVSSFAQNKNAKATLEVDGVCMMCKERIEKATIKTKGVKSAVWNVETHELKLIFDERKTDLESVQKNIAAVGHDTKEFKASEEAYNSVDPCCKYRDEQVVQDHKK